MRRQHHARFGSIEGVDIDVFHRSLVDVVKCPRALTQCDEEHPVAVDLEMWVLREHLFVVLLGDSIQSLQMMRLGQRLIAPVRSPPLIMRVIVGRTPARAGVLGLFAST
jgi:hypothetical protein